MNIRRKDFDGCTVYAIPIRAPTPGAKNSFSKDKSLPLLNLY